MSAVGAILNLLEERALARDVTGKHDDARVSYPLTRNTVSTFDEFRCLVTDYYSHHYGSCVSPGSRLSPSDAWGNARSTLEREYRRTGGDIVSAFNDAHDGTNGGVRVVLDKLAEALKGEATENYTTHVFDNFISPVSWDEKVETIKDFIDRCGIDLASSIDVERPERYARDYDYLIQTYVAGLRHTSSAFRRF